MKLRVLGPTGGDYVIESSTDLQTWTPLTTNSFFNATVDYTDTTAPTFSHRFYRALLEP